MTQRRRRPLSSPLGLVLGTLLFAACSGSAGSPARAGGSPSSAEIEKTLRDLIAAVTPASPAAPPIERSNWFGRRSALLEELRAGGPELGRAALARYRESAEASVDVRIGLLDVAAHAAPQETREVLVDLVTTYGADLGLRTKACELLAVSSPETAVSLLEPLITSSTRGATYPQDDRMVEAWLTAMRSLKRDPAEVLARIVTDPNLPPESRHFAARTLGEEPSPVGRQALEVALTESGGNNYLRRVALQSLQKTLPADEFCPKIRAVFDHEADLNFQIFLSSALEKYCP